MKELPSEAQEFPGCEFVVKKRKIRNVCEAFADLHGVVLYIVATHLGMSAGGGDETGKNLDGGRLAGSVGAEHDKEFTAVHSEA